MPEQHQSDENPEENEGEIAEEQSEEQESSTDDNERERDDAQAQINADLSHIYSSAGIAIAGRDVHFHIQGSADQVKQYLGESYRVRHIPPSPSADEPLQKHVDHWFEYELKTDRLKFFAITLSMFNGLKYPDFKDVYEIVLQVMDVDESGEEEDEKKPPSRFTSDYELHTQVKAKVKRSDNGLEEVIIFEDERYVTAIFDLMRRQYRGVLLDLLPALKQIGERYRYWEVRHRAAVAVAEISKIGFHRARSQVLEPWARHSRDYVRAAVGYPLARLAEDDVSRQAVEELLDDWIDRLRNNPKEWRYCWTAASTFKHIGIIETNGDDWAINWACRGLKKIAGFDDIRLADSVIHSLVVLSLQGQLERVLLTIKEWIEEGSAGSKQDLEPETRCIVGILAFMVLSEIHIELATEEEWEEAKEAGVEVGNLFDLVCQSEADRGEYWQLMIAVGVRAFENRLADAFFNLVERWTKYAADEPCLQNTVRNLLAEVFVQIRPLRRDHILNRLARWEKYSKDEYLVAMAVSAKEKIKDKVLDNPPPSSRASIVFG